MGARKPWDSSTKPSPIVEKPFQSYEMMSLTRNSAYSDETNDYVQLRSVVHPHKSPRSPITHPRKRDVAAPKPDVNTAHTVKVNQPAILLAHVGDVKAGASLTPLRSESLPRVTMKSSYHRTLSTTSGAGDDDGENARRKSNSGAEVAADNADHMIQLTAVVPQDDDNRRVSVQVHTPVMLTLGAPPPVGVAQQQQSHDQPLDQSLLPRQRSSITLNVTPEPMTLKQLPPPPLTRTFSYSSRTGHITPVTDMQDPFSDIDRGRTPSGGDNRVSPATVAPTDGQQGGVWMGGKAVGTVVPARRQQRYSSWKREKVVIKQQQQQQRFRTTVSLKPTLSQPQRYQQPGPQQQQSNSSAFWQDIDAISRDINSVTDNAYNDDDDVFMHISSLRSRSAPQSPSSSPPPSPNRRRTGRSKSMSAVRGSLSSSRTRHMSSPDRKEYYGLCWQTIRSIERRQEEQFW